ncbi:hypothetical protein Cgig2_023506 [Carnegiea gigantea]|uniref:Uncharacterized protein n=1 Tax=Carnegiea gigantea TaxID=171969 RepID=A0A9Q1Q7G8_9CARY|nr:hypothetical protein Cgig2_023506 [Carnegiea gigantea]
MASSLSFTPVTSITPAKPGVLIGNSPVTKIIRVNDGLPKSGTTRFQSVELKHECALVAFIWHRSPSLISSPTFFPSCSGVIISYFVRCCVMYSMLGKWSELKGPFQWTVQGWRTMLAVQVTPFKISYLLAFNHSSRFHISLHSTNPIIRFSPKPKLVPQKKHDINMQNSRATMGVLSWGFLCLGEEDPAVSSILLG